MATEKNISSRIINKHDIEANWDKATNFIPKAGEIIVYDRDETYDYERFKIGDGETAVAALPFGSVQSDWNQNDETAIDYIKNKPIVTIDTPKALTLTWDGNINDKCVFSGSYFKISNITPSIADVKNGYYNLITAQGENVVYEFTTDLIQQITDFSFFIVNDLGGPSIIFISENDVGIDLGDNTIANESGIYFLYIEESGAHISSLTIQDYTSFMANKIDPSYLYQSSWDQNNENAPDYVKNRTHYAIPLIDIKWNGDITGLDTGNIGGYQLYKVADVTDIDFSENNHMSGTVVTTYDGKVTGRESFIQTFERNEFGIYPINPGDILAGIIILNETIAEDMGFPSAGLYLWKQEYSSIIGVYVSSVIIENIKKIDEKYIPFKLNNIVDGNGEYSIEMADQETTALGSHSEAMGHGTFVYGDYSHAEGLSSIGWGSVTLSGDANATTYSLNSAHSAMEVGTILSYNNNYAKIIAYSPDNLTVTLDKTLSYEALLNESVTRIANETIVSGKYSHAEGKGVLVFSDAQHAQGQYNIADSDNTYAHIVGNGTSSSRRSNAHTLDWDGNAWFAGDVYVGSTSGTNKDEGSVKLATVDEIQNRILYENTTVFPHNWYYDRNEKIYIADLNDAKITEGDIAQVIFNSMDIIKYGLYQKNTTKTGRIQLYSITCPTENIVIPQIIVYYNNAMSTITMPPPI